MPESIRFQRVSAVSTAAFPSEVHSPAAKRMCLKHIFEGLDLYGEEEVNAVRQARLKCPHLIAEESNPLVFLRSQRLHSVAAAGRLAAYWDLRLQVWGNEAFSPLKQICGSSSRNQFVLLPQRDTAGRRIFYLNYDDMVSPSSALHCATAKRDLMQSAFLQLSTVSYDRKQVEQQQNGEPHSIDIVLIILVQRRNLWNFCTSKKSEEDQNTCSLLDPHLERFLARALPWSLHAMHVLCLEDNQNMNMQPLQPQLQPLLPPAHQVSFFNTIKNNYQNDVNLKLVLFSTIREAVEYVEWTFDLQQSSIPQELGGSFLAQPSPHSPTAASLKRTIEASNRSACEGGLELCADELPSPGTPPTFLQSQLHDSTATGSPGVGAGARGGANASNTFDRCAGLVAEKGFRASQTFPSGPANADSFVSVCASSRNGNSDMLSAVASIDRAQGLGLSVVLGAGDGVQKQFRPPTASMLYEADASTIAFGKHTSNVPFHGPHSHQEQQQQQQTYYTGRISQNQQPVLKDASQNSGDSGSCKMSPQQKRQRLDCMNEMNSMGDSTDSKPGSISRLSQIHDHIDIENGVFHDSAATQSEGLRKLEEGIQLLPDVDKAALLLATQRCPYLVYTESDPIRFLRVDKYDPWAAARRLAVYWKMRYQLFGAEKAFLPLNITGESALDPEEISMLRANKCGVWLLKDLHGRPVVFYDPAQRTTDWTPHQRFRVGFYIMQRLSENDMTQRDGYVFLFLLGKPSMPIGKLDRGISFGANMSLDAFPMRAHKFHLINYPNGFGERFFYDRILPWSLSLLPLGRDVADRAAIHTGTTEEILSKLEPFGLPASCLVDCVGGNMNSQDYYDQWIMDRVSVEQRRHCVSLSSFPPLGKINKEDCAPETNHPLPNNNLEIRPREETLHSSLASKPNSNEPPRTAECDHIVSSEEATQQHGTKRATSSTIVGALQDLEKAILALPERSKAAYLQAKVQAPELIERESNPMWYLRHEKFDIVAAARRLARYWEVRALLFTNRAYLPMNQTGEGALDRRDLATLASGFVFCLPLTEDGRAVVFCNASRLSKSTRQSRFRCKFYMYSIAAELEKSQIDGFILLHVVMHDPGFFRCNKQILDLVLSAIPASIGVIHLLFSPVETQDKELQQEQKKQHDHEHGDHRHHRQHRQDYHQSEESDLSTSTQPHLEESLSTSSDLVKIDPAVVLQYRELSKNDVVPHYSESRTAFAAIIQPFGFKTESVPRWIGGDFGLDRFFEWQDFRMRYEWDVPAGASHSKNMALFGYDFSRVQTFAELTEEAKNERKRKLNVIHSRRKRERERIASDVLNEQCLEQKEQKNVLELENKRLLVLLAKAKALIPF